MKVRFHQNLIINSRGYREASMKFALNNAIKSIKPPSNGSAQSTTLSSSATISASGNLKLANGFLILSSSRRGSTLASKRSSVRAILERGKPFSHLSLSNISKQLIGTPTAARAAVFGVTRLITQIYIVISPTGMDKSRRTYKQTKTNKKTNNNPQTHKKKKNTTKNAG